MASPTIYYSPAWRLLLAGWLGISCEAEVEAGGRSGRQGAAAARAGAHDYLERRATLRREEQMIAH